MYQKVTIAGYLGRDPEMRYLPSGQPVCNFSVATSRKWTGQDGVQHNETVWWRVAVWGKQAEICNQYLEKGRPVLVEGRVSGERLAQSDGGEQIVPRVWTGQDGQPRASFEMTADRVIFLSGRGGAAEAPGAAPDTDVEEPPEEEIPF